MDEHKVCFIVYHISDVYLEECIKYLNRLIVPEKYSVSLLIVKDESVCRGFNEAMNISDAKYKIYLKDTAFIRKRDFIYSILEIFEEPDIGMIGMLGIEELDNDGVFIHSQRYGGILFNDASLDYKARPVITFDNKYIDVAAIDEFIAVTQYDILWREDIFENEDYCIFSQCGEFKKKGYRIVVPGQGKHAWVINSKNNYFYSEKSRKIFLKEYAEVFNLKTDKLRVLCMYTPGMKFDDISWAFLELGCEPQIMDTDLDMNTESDVINDMYEEIIGSYHPDLLFSYDFIPVFSDVCERIGIPYISWVFDAPQQALSYPAVRNKCNYIFSFDKKQVEQVKKKCAKHVYHLPLGVNTSRLGALIISEEDEKRFSCDVSFVGNNYYDEIYDKLEEIMDADTKAEYNALINEVYNKWDGIDRISEKLSDKCIDRLMDYNRKAFESVDFRMNVKEFFEIRLIAHRAAFLERTEMLRRIAGNDVKFFTKAKNVKIPGVKIYPGIDYASELPKIYHLSRININSTLHTITSGIPLRVFDIMGVGGFVLTNYQPEIEELFIDGVDLAIYRDLDEFEDKVRYYLSHEDERIRIAMNGYKKASTENNLTQRFKLILNTVMNDGCSEMIAKGRTII